MSQLVLSTPCAISGSILPEKSVKQLFHYITASQTGFLVMPAVTGKIVLLVQEAQTTVQAFFAQEAFYAP